MDVSSELERDLIKTGAEIKINEARRVIALHYMLEIFLLADDPFNCLLTLSRELNRIEQLSGRIPQFITGRTEQYLDSVKVIENKIHKKRKQFINHNRPKYKTLKRVRDKIARLQNELEILAQPEWRSDFNRYYARFWNREILEIPLICIRINYFLLKTFSPEKFLASKTAAFYKFCRLQKRLEILGRMESRLTARSSEDHLLLEALDKLEKTKLEIEKQMLKTFDEPFDLLCVLLNKNFRDIYKEFFVILQHSNIAKFFYPDTYDILMDRMQALEKIQITIEELQLEFESLEDKLINMDEKAFYMTRS
jgi:hypothetical protein